ncbi:unnamed protein product [Symbiodinium natans]|uniref:Uncharacterized protein n=1 Tax=Symbiodinium natans TaxID=878477 RepID=A0A812TLN0_9DINO|nr:unnamed protein product [Symbiodinium natans]
MALEDQEAAKLLDVVECELIANCSAAVMSLINRFKMGEINSGTEQPKRSTMAVSQPQDVVGSGRGHYLAPTLASLRAHEIHHASPEPRKDEANVDASSTELPDETPSPPWPQMPAAEVSSSHGNFPMWESEQVTLPSAQKEEEAKAPVKPQREIVTTVDDWFNLGEIFGCFMAREKK